MVTHFIYLLSVKGKPVYIGVSRFPATRLMQHYKNPNHLLAKEFNKTKSVSEISINILDTVKAQGIRVNNKISNIEFYWVHKYLRDGHKLCNKLIKRYSKIDLQT